jgi:hypothetical protein
MKKLQTSLKIDIDGINITYGSIPSGLIDGWNGIVYYFLTNDAYDTELHEKTVGQVISQLESQSFDHWSEWRKTKIEAVVWDELCQITLVSFRVKDSY